MIGSRLGDPVARKTGHLIQSQTVKGEPVLRVDRNCDDKDSRRDPVLVSRINEKADWKPFKNVEELENYLAKASDQDKRYNFGQWKDKREWVFWSPDGQVQNREVKCMFDVNWDKARLHSRAEELHPKYGGPELECAYYVKEDPAQITVERQEGKNPLFIEPIVVTDSYMCRTTEWAVDGPYHIPMGFKTSEYHLFK